MEDKTYSRKQGMIAINVINITDIKYPEGENNFIRQHLMHFKQKIKDKTQIRE